ncbi:MAG: flagellar motor switch protein FliG [Rhodomicrobium sp.]|nr:flagellar motor switch protein FliG [Rhodomicrobium sp.]
MAKSDGAATVKRAFTGPDKAAALLLAMGKPLASKIMRHFEEDEIKTVAESAAGLGAVPRQALEDIITEFTAKIDDGSDLYATISEVEQLLSEVVPPDRVAEIIQDLRGGDKRAVWPRLGQMPETPVANFLMKEHPQVAAFVLSKATPITAAAVLEAMPADLRMDLMKRMLTIKHVLEHPLELLETALHEDLLHKGGAAGSGNIHAKIANIINRMNRDHMDEVFAALNEFRPKEAEKVKGLLFTFEDIIKLRPDAVAKLFDQIPPEQVILALAGADKKLADLILNSLGARNRRMIEQELTSGANPPQRDVLKARRSIADLALKLSERGQIDIHGDDE